MSYGHRILHVEDDTFSRTIVNTLLTGCGYTVESVDSAAAAIELLPTFDPHAVLLDLDLGAGPSGLDVVRYVTTDMPWVAIVIMTGHRSPLLVDPTFNPVAHDFNYVVKADVTSAQMIDSAIQSALMGKKFAVDRQGDVVVITQAQAHVLQMMAAGKSNQEIADDRGTSLRAAEGMIQRTLEALGFGDLDSTYGRAKAIRMYLRSDIEVQ